MSLVERVGQLFALFFCIIFVCHPQQAQAHRGATQHGLGLPFISGKGWITRGARGIATRGFPEALGAPAGVRCVATLRLRHWPPLFSASAPSDQGLTCCS